MRIVFLIVLVGMGILLSPLFYSFGEMMVQAELVARGGERTHLGTINGTHALSLSILGIVVMTIGIFAGLLVRYRPSAGLTRRAAAGSDAG